MLPPDAVLTIKNSGSIRLLFLLCVAVSLTLGGCSPSGPKALLQGREFIDAGNYPAAIEKLSQAVVALPKNALAWNYLGLAYHLDHKPEEAEKRYRTALDLDHNLATVRYNLGCLYLEQENLAAALEELRRYTLLRPGAIDGWLKLGEALTRSRQFDEGERSFRAALDIQARHPEALNGLGLIQLQRRRAQEAINYFNAAALQDPPYAPAVLNAAILNHQVGNRSQALQRYRHYLTLGVSGPDTAAVEQWVKQLESELQPATQAGRVAPAVAVTRTNPPPAQLAGNTRPSVAPGAATQPPAGKTNPPTPAANPTVASAATPAPSKVVTEPSRATVRTNVPKNAEAAAARRDVVEVTQVQPSAVIKPAQELSRTPASAPSPESTVADSPAGSRASTNAQRRGFFSRLNPFGGRNRTNAVGGTGVATGGIKAAGYSGRYTYLSPAAPTAGDAAESERAFKRGVKAQRAGSLSLAITEYQSAVKVDPANYDAYYNLGLAALERGDARLSLWAYEIALALKPSADDAQYNFALALKAGGHWEDAAEQLQALLAESPSDARAHLSLANLCAQQLQQPALARTHYQRLLELNPKHPEAAKIRYWLTANP
jgi:Tfp pilus assembly protein PilF